MKFLTQFYYEKTWSKVSSKEVLKLIQDEFPDIPAEGTFTYVEEECKKGKVIVIGESKFKEDK
ncbi:MAG TPA: hypothetical protein EYO73_01120 [Sulfurimonas sp.]|nr:hypothetical protein [Sulfurimonas sp.]